ncbi:type II toxin-antitoxin system HicA family toxin [uncultured Nostoc sp.]|uniref:type II toxin-antitoxin system HicA family toxin n=1 Tax=uncultured Nostoc sp. TaxID=340711 RepID=UPI0035C9C353
MSNVPVLKPQEVVRILESLGFVEIRQKGSHKQFRHEDGRGIVQYVSMKRKSEPHSQDNVEKAKKQI